MKTAPKTALTILAAAMLAACGGGGDYSSNYEPTSPSQESSTDSGDSFTATTSIGAITTSGVQANGSVYREGQP